MCGFTLVLCYQWKYQLLFSPALILSTGFTKKPLRTVCCIRALFFVSSECRVNAVVATGGNNLQRHANNILSILIICSQDRTGNKKRKDRATLSGLIFLLCVFACFVKYTIIKNLIYKIYTDSYKVNLNKCTDVPS